jgi:(1->4)-alpha-D-glucan 1-alpha-D-glucosylmutase
MEYLLYQTLVGAHPLPLDRALAYMEKAAREAGRATSWTAPNDRYERALASFVRGVLDDPIFAADLAAFVAPLILPGRITSLAQTLIRLTVPGVPDLYQGDELWDLSLVDPDDRRPVDHDLRQRLQAELAGMSAGELLARMDEGLPKLHVIVQALRLRSERPGAFAGAHEALAVTGERAQHVVAFVRGSEIATIVPRLVIGLAGDWRDTRVVLPEGRWCDRLTGRPQAGGPARVAELLGGFPVALLTRE